MSLYNMINGVNPMTFLVLPMLDRHPDEYPRFRDCFLGDEEHPEYDKHIHVYTRVGGNNRGQGYGEDELMNHPNFITTYDDSFDNTYGSYIFSVPEKWKNDFEKIYAGNLGEVSKEYQDKIKKTFPKIEDQISEIFAR